MKIKLFYITISFLFLFSFNNISYASNNSTDRYVTINGSSLFYSSLIAKYMEKHGYLHIGEFSVKSHLKTNVFAAKDAEVIIQNKYNMIMGTAIVDEKGHFSITVARNNLYKIIVKFHGREIEESIKTPDTEGIILHFGFIASETIDSWFENISLSYCYTCDIKYLETNKYR